MPQTIRGKLGLAFGVVAAAAIVGGVVGQSSYDVIGQKLAIITEVSVPSVIAAQRIGELTARIAAAAPALHGADGEAALTAQHDELTAQMSELRAAVEDLARLSGDAESIRKMNLLADKVASTLVVQTKSVTERLGLAKQSHANVEALAGEHVRFNASIQPIIEVAMEEFRVSSAGVIENTDQSIKRLNELTMKGLLPILLLRVQANNMAQAIGAVPTATTPEQIDSLWQAFVSANSVASRQFKTLQQNKALAEFLDIEPVKHIFKQVASLGVGDGNVFDRRLQNLAAADEAAVGSTEAPATDREAKGIATLEADLDRTLNRLITLIRGRTATEGFDIKQYVSETLNTMATEGLIGIGDLQKLEALGNHIAGVLTTAALLESERELDTFRVNFARAVREFDGILDKYEGDPTMSPAIKSARHLISLGNGDLNLFAIRVRELQAIARGRQSLGESLRLIEELSATATRIVQATRTDSAQAAGAAARSLATSGWTLAAAATTGVLVLLIVWMYVRHSLGARLTALSNSMRAIADGNLKAQMPPGGGDEIGRMAEALAIFRDTAIEVEEKNLREIEQAQQRLVDAIENTSEGFAFYDAQDRLELCNSRYQEMLYPGAAGSIAPGMTFETIIRKAAEQGLIAGAEGRVDEWVAERVAKHHNPGEPHLQQRGDGRWILISEHKTDYGGTVAVYADITDLKQREEELAEKSNALEQLSNQLAKYLSPQVYDSIFSGKQEVKVASNRKKLTVFFSDIADFTETADKLESEELTQLLNHYLTEMSQIALDHGATVDKYVGDAILIFFGDPETKGIKEDALACVKMAIAMRKRMHDLERIWRDSGIEKPLQCRMGIHTDYCTVGNFGSEDRMDYTIIGGGVNTASRLETSATPGDILISYETFAHVSDQIHCEERGHIDVKGIAYPIATYQVIDTYENLGKEPKHFREDHPNVKLDLDLDAMSADDRGTAAAILRRALDHLSAHDEIAHPEQARKNEPNRERPARSESDQGAQLSKAR
ncbi:MAG: adenylate/guanylate cyclase domain-containing protein [Kiloniellaceae bacterium]